MLGRLISTARIRVSLLGLLALMIAQEPPSVREVRTADSFERAKELAWLNNWTEAARVLQRLHRSARLGSDERTLTFSRGVEIRGSIESLALPSAAHELTTLASSDAAQSDPELRLHILAMRADVEFQYDLRAAERTWNEVRRAAAALDDEGWEARAGGELGCIAFLNGEIYTALRRVVKAYFKAEVSNDVAAKMKTLTALGEGLAEFGRPADALRFFNRVLSLSAANPDAYFPFTAYLGKARLLLAGERAEEGRRMLLQGLEEARGEKFRVRETRILAVLGEDAARRRDRAGAVQWLEAAVGVARQAGLHRLEADAGGKLATVLSDLGELSRASEYAKASVAAAGRAGDVYHLPQKLAGLGAIEGNRGDLWAAKTAYEEATRVVSSLFADLPDRRHENTVVATMGGVFQSYFEFALDRLNDPALAFEILESARARGVVDKIRYRESELRPAEPRDRVMVRKIEDLNRRLSVEQDAPDRRHLLDRLWETELRSLRFSTGGSGSVTLSGAKPVSLRTLQAKLGTDDLLIEYLLGPARSFAFAVTRDQATPYVLPGRKEIEAGLDRQLQAVKRKSDANEEGSAVYDLLLRPIAPLGSKSRIIIVPDGKVDMAPLGAAVNPVGRYLMETHVLSFAPSATTFCLLSEAGGWPARQPRLLAVGGAQYPATLLVSGQAHDRGGGLFALVPPRFSKLSRSGAEVTDVAATGIWDARSLTGEEATEGVLKRLQLSDFDVLHFSLHSAIDRDFPDRSGLVLTSHGDEREDDLLQAREIMGLQLNADLVTLSACDGAAGTPEGIAGTNSLVQAFLMAGARSVIGSVWEADDAFTAALMRRFYEKLQLGHDKAEALTLAKRKLLEEWGPSAVPVYWAGFRLVGDAHGRIVGE